jgi:Holliday junction resolvase RusA-like endonuclease
MTTATVLTIRLPLCPDVELSPNHRGHWRRKAASVKRMRQIAYYMGVQSMWSQDWSTATGPVTVRATIGWAKGRKRMDPTNVEITLKPVFDGFEDAGIYVNDKQVTVESVSQERDPAGFGYIVVEVLA